MWVQPTVINGSSLGRTKWKMMQQSLYFLLQQGPSEMTTDGTSYRIVTRSFPTYIIACSETLPPSLDHFRFLHEEFLEQMPVKKPKELVKNIKAYYLNFPDYQAPPTDDAIVEEAVTARLNERIEKALSRHFAPSELMSFAEVSEGSEDEAPHLRSLSPETTSSIHKHSRKAKRELREPESNNAEKPEDFIHSPSARRMLNKPDYDLYVDLVPGVQYEIKRLCFPGLEHTGFRGFFRRLIGLLCYPSIYLDDGLSCKTSFQFLSEVQAVSVRRKMLFGVTLYTAFMRYCSLDLFYVLLFLTNIAALFFMRDSFKVNEIVSKSFNLSQDSAVTTETSPKDTFKQPSAFENVNVDVQSAHEFLNQAETSEYSTSNHPNGNEVILNQFNVPSHRDNSATALNVQSPRHLASFVSLPPNRAPSKKEIRRASSSERLKPADQYKSPTFVRPSLPNLRSNQMRAIEPDDRPLSVVFPSNH
ncbi:hypothetical protein L0F63_005850 [Massospora cicadina]|nr:hypothetical protein L0F63_005850 [Massospora cicadina]